MPKVSLNWIHMAMVATLADEWGSCASKEQVQSITVENR